MSSFANLKRSRNDLDKLTKAIEDSTSPTSKEAGQKTIPDSGNLLLIKQAMAWQLFAFSPHLR